MGEIGLKLADLFNAALYVKAPIVVVCWIQVLVLVGLGHLVSGVLFHPATPDSPRLPPGHKGLLGMMAAALVAMVWHLFLPLNSSFALIVGVAGLLGAILALRPRAIAQWRDGETLQLAIMLSVAAFASLTAARNYLIHGDSGLYHVPTLILNSASPIELGAANIHMRFGYNSSLYPLAAAFFYPVLGAASSEIINSTLTAVFVAGVFASVNWKRLSDPLTLVAGGLLLFHLCHYTSLAPGQGTASTDWPAFLASSFCVVMGFRLAADLDERPFDRRTAANLLLLCCVAAIAVTIKLTQIFTPLIAVAAVWLCWRAARALMGPVALAAGMFCAIVALWVGRGVMLSGCLLYPVSRSCLPWLPWTVSPDTAQDDLAYMAAFGKVPGGASPSEVPSFSVWFPNWLADLASQAFAKECLALLVVTLAFVILRVAAPSRVRMAAEACGPAAKIMLAAIMAVAIGNTAVWLVVAPLPRYGEGSLVVLAAVLAAVTCPVPVSAGERLARRAAAVSMHARSVVAVLIAGYAVLCSFGLLATRNNPTVVLWPRLPEVKTVLARTPYGFEFQRPADGSYLCGAAPQPCSYHASAAPKQHVLIWTMIPNGAR